MDGRAHSERQQNSAFRGSASSAARPPMWSPAFPGRPSGPVDTPAAPQHCGLPVSADGGDPLDGVEGSAPAEFVSRFPAISSTAPSPATGRPPHTGPRSSAGLQPTGDSPPPVRKITRCQMRYHSSGTVP